MHPVAHRLDACPRRRRVSEHSPGVIEELVRLDVAAGKREDDRVIGKILDRMEQRVGYDWIRGPEVK